MKGFEESGPWVVYRVVQGDAAGSMSLCQESEWDALRSAGRGVYELIRNNISGEGEAERFARGSSGNAFNLGRRPKRRHESSQGDGAHTEAEPLFKILVVDDNADAATSLAMLLRLHGHSVCTAFDGLSALRVAESQVPDIAILDIGLPRLNGYEVAKRIGSEPWGQHIVLFALTGWTGDENLQRASASGFVEVLAKPVDYEALTLLMSRHVTTAAPSAVGELAGDTQSG